MFDSYALTFRTSEFGILVFPDREIKRKFFIALLTLKIITGHGFLLKNRVIIYGMINNILSTTMSIVTIFKPGM